MFRCCSFTAQRPVSERRLIENYVNLEMRHNAFLGVLESKLRASRIAKSTKGGRTFSYLAPKLWNSLPDNVRGSDTLSLFKSRLKTHLFSQTFI